MLDSNREIGIDLDHKRRDILRPKLVKTNCCLEWDKLKDPETCRYQGYFYEDG